MSTTLVTLVNATWLGLLLKKKMDMKYGIYFKNIFKTGCAALMTYGICLLIYRLLICKLLIYRLRTCKLLAYRLLSCRLLAYRLLTHRLLIWPDRLGTASGTECHGFI